MYFCAEPPKLCKLLRLTGKKQNKQLLYASSLTQLNANSPLQSYSCYLPAHTADMPPTANPTDSRSNASSISIPASSWS